MERYRICHDGAMDAGADDMVCWCSSVALEARQTAGYRKGRPVKLVPLFWKSWSFWLMILTAILGAAEAALPLFTSVVPPRSFALASMVTGIAAAVARTIQQQSMHPNEKPD